MNIPAAKIYFPEEDIESIKNIEGTEQITIKQIAETVKKLLGNVQIAYVAARAGDYEGKNVSAEKAKRELGWSPQITFEEGMKKYIEWRKVSK